MEKKRELTAEQRAAIAESKKRYLTQFADFKIRITPEERNKIQTHASAKGESMAAFVRRAIWETIERDENQ